MLWLRTFLIYAHLTLAFCRVCRNGGVWLENARICRCVHGFYGTNCQNMLCKHGTIIGERNCSCENGYSGQFCTIPIENCRHGRLESGICFCEENWGGPTCNLPVCKNGLRLGHTCQCNKRWRGRFCEFKEEQHSALKCSNGQCEKNSSYSLLHNQRLILIVAGAACLTGFCALMVCLVLKKALYKRKPLEINVAPPPEVYTTPVPMNYVNRQNGAVTPVEISTAETSL